MRESERRAAVRFPARLILASPIHCIAFGGGSGLAPVAPGTFGTLPGVLLFLALMGLPEEWFVFVLAELTAIGAWLADRSSARLGVHDHPGIVIDEIIGFAWAAFPLLPALGWVQTPLWLSLTVIFVAFRFFDAVKPPPIGWLDRRVHGGIGIMVDDLLAALMAAVAGGLLLRLIDLAWGG